MTVIILSFVQICNEGCQTDPVEILEILFVVCEEFKLPIVQTRVPCKHQSLLSHGGGLTKSSLSFDGSCMERGMHLNSLTLRICQLCLA
jgi:hypothetical protein